MLEKILMTLAILAIVTTGWFFLQTIRYGVNCRKKREHGGTEEEIQKVLTQHTFYLKYLSSIAFFAVACIEGLRLYHGGLWGPNWLIYLHLFFVAIFIGTLSFTRKKWNGLVRPDIHRKAAYSVIAFFLLILITGTCLFAYHPLFQNM